MKSTGTDMIRAGRNSPACRRPPRGVAEIELLLVIIMILLPILFLIGGAWRIGRVRVRAAADAENGAYAQVISGINVTTYGDDPLPPPGILSVRLGLPNRLDSERINGTVMLDYGSAGAHAVTYGERAIFLDPAWQWSAYPYSAQGNADHAMVAEWFENYAGEAKTPEIVSSLGLQPAGPP